MADEVTTEGGLAPTSTPVVAAPPAEASATIATPVDTPIASPKDPVPPAITPAQDAGPDYIKKSKALALKAAKDENDAYIRSQGIDPVEEAKKQAEAADPTDKHGIAFRFAADVAKGVMESPSRVLKGGTDAIFGVIDNMASVAQWINDNLDEKHQFIDPENGLHMGADATAAAQGMIKKATGEAKSTTGAALEGFTRFMAGFIPVARGMKALTGATGAIATIASTEAAAAIAGAAVFDPQEANLSNWLAENATWTKPVTQFLMHNPGDSKSEGALKNAVESMGFGAVTEGVFAGLKYGLNAIKSSRLSRGVSLTSKGAGGPDAPIDTQLGTKDGAFLKQETVDKMLTGKATPADIADGLNFGQIVDLKSVEDAVTRFQKIAKKSGAVAEEPVTFSTEKGSKYAVQADGTTIRDKAARTDIGHEGQSGIQPKSEATVYVSDADLSKLDIIQATSPYKLQMVHDNGTVAIKYVDGPNAGKILRDTIVKGADGPAVGLTPVELFKGGQSVHFGNKITEVGGDLGARVEGSAFAGSRAGRVGVVGDAQVKRLATNLGVTPEDVLGNKMFLKGNRAIDAERMYAVSNLLEAANEKVMQVAAKAHGSTDMADFLALKRMMDTHYGIYKYFEGAGAEAGRTLRIRQLPPGSTAKQIAAMTDELAEAGGIDKLREAAGVLKDRENITKAGRAKAQRLAQGGPISNSIQAYWYFSMLSGLKTHAVNMTSNALNMMWQIPERALAAQVSKLRGATDGVQEGEAKAMFFGMINSFGSGLRAAGRTLATGEATDAFGAVYKGRDQAISGAKWGITGPEGSAGHAMGKAVDLLGTVINSPTRLLQSEDEFFKHIAIKMETEAQAVRSAAVHDNLEGAEAAGRIQEIRENPSHDILQASQDFSKDVTFTTPLGEQGSKAQAWINSNPITRAVVPFFKVSTNLIKWVGLRSPLAPLARSVRADIMGGGAKADLAIAKMSLGSMIGLTFADQAWQGNVTGNGPENPELQAMWRIKNQPFSFKLPTAVVDAVDKTLNTVTFGVAGGVSAFMRKDAGDGMTWVAYNRMDPFGTMLGTAASFGEMVGNMSDPDKEQVAGSLALSLAKVATDKVWTKTAADALEAVYGPPGAGEKWLQRMAGTLFIPNVFAQPAKDMDPVWRDVQSITDAVRARIPGFSKDLPPHRNIWGDAIHMEGGIGPDIISPFYTQKEGHDPATDWAIKNQVGLQAAARTQSFSKTGGDVQLTPKEYSDFVELAGNKAKDPATGKGFHDTVNATIAGEGPYAEQWRQYTDGPQGSRQMMLRDMAQGFRKLAKDQMMKDSPDLAERVRMADQEKSDLLFKGPKSTRTGGGPSFGPTN